MSKKNYIYIFIAILISSLTLFGSYKSYSSPVELYRVYLSGKTIGYIKSKKELENYINDKELEIKKKYNVSSVYAPKDLDIVKEETYSKKTTSVDDIYNIIKSQSPFTVKGYTVTIKGLEEIKEDGEKSITPDININVLQKNLFEESAKNLISIFLDNNKYEEYVNETQKEITDVGSIIENIYIENDITIKENKISTNEEIFTNVEDLSKYLLFGTLQEQQKYTVKLGDTIERVSYDNKLSVEEFLIANEEFNSVDNLLYPGQVVTLGILKPAFNLIEEDHVVEVETSKYKTEIVYDNTILTGVEQVKQQGVDGKNKVTKKIKKSNGETVSAVVVSSEEIVAPVNKIIVRGNGTIMTGSLGSWAWPTNIPYIITSNYGWRWGKLHEGVDISGPGHGSPIYAANDGVVEKAEFNSYNGNYIIINHNNGFYTYYGHMSSLLVRKGDIVAIGQQIGKMGATGFATGTHLHFGLYKGYPFRNPSVNPLSLFK